MSRPAGLAAGGTGCTAPKPQRASKFNLESPFRTPESQRQAKAGLLSGHPRAIQISY